MVNKSKMKDKMGRPLTQGLFLEINYDTEFAQFTLDEQDKTYKGVVYPSLKRLYMEAQDPTEYQFAIDNLLGWDHWQRLKRNRVLNKYFSKWAAELEVCIRSEAVRNIIDCAVGDSGFQASKWLADRGWEKRKPGRPSKEDIDKEHAIQENIEEEFALDAERMSKVNGSSLAKRSTH